MVQFAGRQKDLPRQCQPDPAADHEATGDARQQPRPPRREKFSRAACEYENFELDRMFEHACRSLRRRKKGVSAGAQRRQLADAETG